jgi:hypothetical protein
MSKRTKHTFDAKRLVEAIYSHVGTWQAVANELGHSPAFWNLIAKGGKVNKDAENMLRFRLRIAPRGVTRIERMKTETLKKYFSERREM